MKCVSKSHAKGSEEERAHEDESFDHSHRSRDTVDEEDSISGETKLLVDGGTEVGVDVDSGWEHECVKRSGEQTSKGEAGNEDENALNCDPT